MVMMANDPDPKCESRSTVGPLDKNVQKMAVCYAIVGNNYRATVIEESLVSCDTLSYNYDRARRRREWQ
jgi:hypothetical protein